MQTLPKINTGYWVTLVLASIFGTNTGDFFSEGLDLGYFVGLPWLAAILIAIFITERLSPWKNAVFFWAAIITIRTGATNIGDIFHHFGIGFATSIPIVLVVYAVCVGIYRHYWIVSAASGSVGVNPVYWLTMIVAGVLGTVGGDAASFGLHLTPYGTALVFGVFVAAALFYWERRGRIADPLPYWTTLALIRTCGTGAGDALSHLFGFGPSTLVTGFAFIAAVTYFYIVRRNNQIVVGVPAGETA